MRKNNTVSIAQSGGYYRRRARVNIAEGRMFDAYKLMQRALEKTPDDAGLWLDSAALLSDMGLCEKSSAQITRAMLLGAPKDALMYALYKNLLARQRYDEASALLSAGKLTHAADCESEPAFIPTREERRGIRLLLRGAPLEKAMGYAVSSAYLSALIAIGLMTERRKDEARAKALEAKKLLRKSSDIEAVCVAAQALALCALKAEAERVLARVDMRYVPKRAQNSFIRALSLIGAHAKIHDYCAYRASGGAFDPQILHALSVSGIALGLDRDKALKGFERILECDGQELITLEFLAAYERGELTGAPDEYRHELSAQMLISLNERLADMTRCPTSIDAAFAERLCYFKGDRHLQEVGVWLLALKNDLGSRETLSALSIRSDVGLNARRAAQSLIGSAAYEDISHRYPAVRRGFESASERQIKHGAVWLKRIYEEVCYVLGRQGQGARGRLAADIIARASRKPRLRRYMFDHMYAACAAILYLSQKSGDDEKRRLKAQNEYDVSAQGFDNMLSRLSEARKG